MYMDTSVYIAIITAIGIIGASLGSQLIAARSSANRDREQWERTQEAQKNEWLRSKLLEIYSNCIEYLSKIPDAAERGDGFDPVTQKRVITSYRMEIFNEAHKWLYMLLVFHPEKDAIENRKLFEEVAHFSNLPPSQQQQEAPSLRDKILKLAAEDPRVKVK